MSELNYRRLLQAISVQVKRNGISMEATNALDKILELPHPSKELAFLDWALNIDLYSQGCDLSVKHRLSHDQISL